MTFKLICFFSSCHIEYFDCSIFIGDQNKLITFIEDCTVWWWESTVELTGFFYHSDIPNFVYSITVTWYNQVSSLIEFHRVNSVIVTVKCLNTKICPNIPEWNCFITGPRHKHAWIWLPINRVNWVNMTSKCESTCFCLYHIPKLDRMIHWTWNQKISWIMKFTFPYWLAMLWICCLTPSIQEIPYFDTSITRSGCKLISFRMKWYTSYPILMSFSTHY